MNRKQSMKRDENTCCHGRQACVSGREDREENGRVHIEEPELGDGEGSHEQMVKGRLDWILQTRVSQNGVYMSR